MGLRHLCHLRPCRPLLHLLHVRHRRRRSRLGHLRHLRSLHLEELVKPLIQGRHLRRQLDDEVGHRIDPYNHLLHLRLAALKRGDLGRPMVDARIHLLRRDLNLLSYHCVAAKEPQNSEM